MAVFPRTPGQSGPLVIVCQQRNAGRRGKQSHPGQADPKATSPAGTIPAGYEYFCRLSAADHNLPEAVTP
jgi:hypothetical protein